MEKEYYYPDLDLEGTADTLYVQARNGYINDPDALKKIAEILNSEEKKEKAERVGYMLERETGTNATYSIGQIKLDLLDGIGTEDIVIDNIKLSVVREDDNVLISVQNTETEEESKIKTAAIPLKRFLAFSEKQMDVLVGEILYY